MVKLKGPSLAQTAAGGLGKTVIFSQSKGRTYLKRWAKPANPRSPGQTAMRAITAYLSQIWAVLPDADKASWLDQATAADVSPFNAALTYNLRRWRRQANPATLFPANETLPRQNFAGNTVTIVGRGIQHVQSSTLLNDGRGFMIFRSTTTPVTMDWANLVRINPCLPFLSPFTWTDHPNSGTWYYTTAVVSADGLREANWQRGPFVIP